MRVAVRAAMVLAVALLAGCGGDDTPALAEGFAQETRRAATFARPSDFVVSPPQEGDERVRWRWDAPEGDARRPFVDFEIVPGRGEDFHEHVDGLIESYRALGGAEVEDAEVDVPGADAARRLDIVPPSNERRDAEVLRTTLVVARHGEDLYQLSAGAPLAEADSFDRDAVVDSLRLDG